MVSVDHVEQIEIAVISEIGIQCQTQHAMIGEDPDFLAYVDDWAAYRLFRVQYPNRSAALPDPSTTIVLKTHAYSFVPGSSIRTRD